MPAILESWARFSDDRVYRWELGRVWDFTLPRRLWIMLNPSTADEVENDPTVERCFRRTVADGFGSMVVCNIFALRSTDPSALYDHEDPVGLYNDTAIQDAAAGARQVILAYGTHGRHRGRGREVIEMLRVARTELHVLTQTREGHPGHPLYIAYDVKPYQLAL